MNRTTAELPPELLRELWYRKNQEIEVLQGGWRKAKIISKVRNNSKSGSMSRRYVVMFPDGAQNIITIDYIRLIE